MWDSRGILDSPGKIISIVAATFVFVVLLGFLATLAGSQGVANACSVVNQPGTGLICISEADAVVFYKTDGSRPLTGDMPVAGFSLLDTGSVVFTNALSNPATNGELQRNGANLLYYDGTDARSFLHQAMQSGQCATYVVSSTAPAALITAATQAKFDYGAAIQIADGTADEVQFNAAIAVDPNGRLCFSQGGYATAATIANTGNPTDAAGFEMVGAGMGDYASGSSLVSEIVYSGAGVAIQMGNGVFEGGPPNMRLSNFRLVGNASATHGILVDAAPRMNVEYVSITGFTANPSYAIEAVEDNPGMLIQRVSISGNHHGIWFRNESADSVIRQNRIAANAGIGLICGDVGDTFAPIQLLVAENIFNSNAGDGVHLEYCRHAQVRDNHYAPSAASAGEIMIRVGSTSGSADLETVTITGNWYRGRGTSNDAIVIASNARYSILTFSDNNCHDWVQSCLDNTNVAVSTDNYGWIIDAGDNSFTDGSGASNSTHNLFAVSGAAGGVIRAQSRDSYVAAMQQILGPDAFLFVPDYSDGLTSTDAGRNAYEIDWYANTTPTSVQAWATKPLRLGNGLNFTTTQAAKTHGRIDDAAWWTWNDAGSDIPVTMISLIRPVTVQQNPIFTKFDITTAAEEREWRFFGGTITNALTYRQYDESEGNTYVGRVADAGMTDDRYTLVAVTNDTTGATTTDNLKLYAFDGATYYGLLASSADNSGSYVAMENTTAQPWVGSYKETAAVGNACACNQGLTIAVRGEALTEDELWLVAALTQAYAGIPLISR